MSKDKVGEREAVPRTRIETRFAELAVKNARH